MFLGGAASPEKPVLASMDDARFNQTCCKEEAAAWQQTSGWGNKRRSHQRAWTKLPSPIPASHRTGFLEGLHNALELHRLVAVDRLPMLRQGNG